MYIQYIHMYNSQNWFFVQELFDMASEPRKEHSFIVDSFEEFEALARRALHKGKPCKMMSIGLQQICFKSWKQ